MDQKSIKTTGLAAEFAILYMDAVLHPLSQDKWREACLVAMEIDEACALGPDVKKLMDTMMDASRVGHERSWIARAMKLDAETGDTDG